MLTDDERIELAIEEGKIDIFADDSPYLENTIKKLNDDAKVGWVKREKWRSFQGLFFKVNVALLALLSLPKPIIEVLAMEPSSTIIRTVIVVFIWVFAAIALLGSKELKYRYEVATALELILLIGTPFYAVNIVFSVIYCTIYHKKEETYKALPGYPNFPRITVNYLNRNKYDLKEKTE